MSASDPPDGGGAAFAVDLIGGGANAAWQVILQTIGGLPCSVDTGLSDGVGTHLVDFGGFDPAFLAEFDAIQVPISSTGMARMLAGLGGFAAMRRRRPAEAAA